MIRPAISLNIASGAVLVVAVALGACAKLKQNDPRDAGKLRAEAKRQQNACGSQVAYDRLKALMFDKAIGTRTGDPANLNTLSDYSVARMEQPVVKGFDSALDVTRCKGRFVLDVPPGAERGLGGKRRLQADVDYTAQVAADGNGLVYQVVGADPIVAKLAAFDLNGRAYRPPPAIDEASGAPANSVPIAVARADVAPIPRDVASRPVPVAQPRSAEPAAPREPYTPPRAPAPEPRPVPPPPRQTFAPRRAPDAYASTSSDRGPDAGDGGAGEAFVRSFYDALGQGDGEAASAHLVPEKRASRAFSADAISRFYGGMPEPLRLTGIAPAGHGAYRVSYRYSAGRSRCNGSAIVSVTNRDGRDLIRSIRALNGC